MRNFLQFIIPILIIGVIGSIMMLTSTNKDGTKQLYIKCNDFSKEFTILSTDIIEFKPKEEACNLKLEIINVDNAYVKLGTPLLYRLDFTGNIHEEEGPRNNHIVEAGNDLILYTRDKKTKFVLQYK